MNTMQQRNSYYALAFAIVELLCKDFEEALRMRVRAGEDPLTAYVGIEHEFRSRWFGALCDIDGEEVMQAIRKRVAKKYKGAGRVYARGRQHYTPDIDIYVIELEDGTIKYRGGLYELKYICGIPEIVARSMSSNGYWSKKRIDGQRYHIRKEVKK